MSRLLLALLLLQLAAFALAWQHSRRLPPPEGILPALWQSPLQRPVSQPRFTLQHAGVAYEVEPVAEYRLRGLVVSHNDIHGIADIYHDETALDTKDLCVVWGDNLRSGDYRQVRYSSGPWTCYFRYPAGVRFDATQLSNNHLIGDSDTLRRLLDSVRIGDQIEVEGWLANYRDLRHPEFWRRSSLSRSDSGNGACEVLFMRGFTVLQRHAPGAYALRGWLPWTMAATLLLMFLAVALEPGFNRQRPPGGRPMAAGGRGA